MHYFTKASTEQMCGEDAVKLKIVNRLNALENNLAICNANKCNCEAWSIPSLDPSTKQTMYIVTNLPVAIAITKGELSSLPSISIDLTNQCLTVVQHGAYQKCIDAVRPHQAAHIDYADLISGKPLGGDGAITVQVREALLNGLGVSGDAGKFIRDPVNTTETLVNQLGSSLNQLASDLTRGLQGTIENLPKICIIMCN